MKPIGVGHNEVLSVLHEHNACAPALRWFVDGATATPPLALPEIWRTVPDVEWRSWFTWRVVGHVETIHMIAKGIHVLFDPEKDGYPGLGGCAALLSLVDETQGVAVRPELQWPVHGWVRDKQRDVAHMLAVNARYSGVIREVTSSILRLSEAVIVLEVPKARIEWSVDSLVYNAARHLMAAIDLSKNEERIQCRRRVDAAMLADMPWERIEEALVAKINDSE